MLLRTSLHDTTDAFGWQGVYAALEYAVHDAMNGIG